MLPAKLGLLRATRTAYQVGNPDDANWFTVAIGAISGEIEKVLSGAFTVGETVLIPAAGMAAARYLETGAVFASILVTAIEQPEGTTATCQAFLALAEERPGRWMVSVADIRDLGSGPITLARG